MTTLQVNPSTQTMYDHEDTEYQLNKLGNPEILVGGVFLSMDDLLYAVEMLKEATEVNQFVEKE